MQEDIQEPNVKQVSYNWANNCHLVESDFTEYVTPCLLLFAFTYYTLLQNNIHVCLIYVQCIQSMEIKKTLKTKLHEFG